MRSINKIFNNKSSWQQNSFTDIINSGEQLVVFCSENVYHTSAVLSHILTWRDHFKQIALILPEFEYSFFKRLEKKESIVCFSNRSEIKPFKNSVIFNFSSERKARKIVDKCLRSSILDINNPANLQFIPTPADPVMMLKEFADFFDFSWGTYQYEIDTSNSELMVARHQFIKNRFKNFILDFSKSFPTNKIEKIVHKLKQDFSANIYFTNKKITDKSLINIEEIKIADLLELYNLAKVSDILITDKQTIAGTFSKLGIKQVYLGLDFGCENLQFTAPDNLVHLSKIINDSLITNS
ncbi:MAG: hypothetical protein K9N07_08915 [Candidatus Cloacimonetes bacterium]|nr:hypothetical protein [Candidatus Cloacimonadota bacterium]